MAERNNKVPEDVVEYLLFPNLSDSGKGSFSNSDSIGYIRTYLTSLSPLLIDVVWQKEGFKLKPTEESGKSKVKRFIMNSVYTVIKNLHWHAIYILAISFFWVFWKCLKSLFEVINLLYENSLKVCLNLQAHSIVLKLWLIKWYKMYINVFKSECVNQNKELTKTMTECWNFSQYIINRER